MWRQKISFVCFLVLVSSEEPNRRKYEDTSRKGRLFTFNTVDDEIKLEMQFTIPFITIPAKKAVDSFHESWPGISAININPATLAVGSAIVIGTTLVLPLALKTFAHNSHHGYSRLLNIAEFKTDAFLDLAANMLSNGQSVQACMLRVACWTAQRSKSEYVRALQDITSNTLLSSVINSTAVKEAMLSGWKGEDCSTYNPCPLRDEHIPIILSNIPSFFY